MPHFRKSDSVQLLQCCVAVLQNQKYFYTLHYTYSTFSINCTNLYDVVDNREPAEHGQKAWKTYLCGNSHATPYVVFSSPIYHNCSESENKYEVRIWQCKYTSQIFFVWMTCVERQVCTNGARKAGTISYMDQHSFQVTFWCTISCTQRVLTKNI